jgi:ribosome-binding protein aMBF1 (putative translation factor)
MSATAHVAPGPRPMLERNKPVGEAERAAREALGHLIRDSRRRVGISQLALAAALGLRSAQSISNIERGDAKLPGKHLAAVSRLLDIDQQVLIEYMLQIQRGAMMDRRAAR